MNEDKIIEAILTLTDKVDRIVMKIDTDMVTKSEFHQFVVSQDTLIGELRAIRDEGTLSTHRLRDHEDRIESLENIIPKLKIKLA